MLTSSRHHQRQPSDPFPGFEPLTANYVYTPNQFFDVLLPYGSRGCVRLVAYLLRRTLGWLDANGEPIEQEITVSWTELIERAGISRGALREVLDEALRRKFIAQVQAGRAKGVGEQGQSAQYRLRWGSETEYLKSPERFDGFFRGEGHRTPVPNAFFDRVVPEAPLAVTKVVGTVLRHTIGYQNQFGGRRTSTPLSYQQIANYAHLSIGKTLAQAIRLADEAGYIARIELGNFSPDRSQQQATCYGVRWLQQGLNRRIGSDIPSEVEWFNKPIRNGSETPPEDRFKKPITIKTEHKDTLKQQQAAAMKEGIILLRNQGFDRHSAVRLIEQQGIEVVQNQIAWLDARKPTENRVGMLRKAIEENWPKPRSVQHREKRHELRTRQQTKDAQQVREEVAIAAKKQQRRDRQQRLLAEWGSASLEERRQWIQTTVERETSTRLADIIRRESVKSPQPHLQVLETIAVDRNLPRVLVLDDR
ncbi:MAG: hypothetical protein R3C01_02110 [Planctomycetaceae bacterium]